MQTEDALAHDQRDTLFRLFEEAPGLVAILEGPQHRFAFANAAYLKLLARDNVLGLTVAEALPEVVKQGFIDLLNQVFTTGERFKAAGVPVELQPPDESSSRLHYLNLLYEPMRNAQGRVTGIFLSGQDLTDEIEAQQNLLSLQGQVLHLSRLSAMGTMAQTLAHELNQPLTAIQNYVSGSQRLLDATAIFPELKVPLKEIAGNVRRIAQIIQSARRLMTRGETKEESYLLQSAVREAGALLKIAQPDSPSIQYKLSEGGVLRGDPIQIQQVILNLLRNACEASRDAPVPQVLVRSAISKGLATVTVEDNGPGISPEVLPRLFETFHTTKVNGLGVGLSICRTIIEAHQGRIWAENRQEGGARVSFNLPLSGHVTENSAEVSAALSRYVAGVAERSEMRNRHSEELEASQARLRKSIKKTERLVSEADELLRQHRQEWEEGDASSY